jgi:DNA primase
MAKLAPTSIKYIIKASIKAKGIIEKPDVIGAVFGQTEGLLGSDLDLRELQRTGRIGRIEVNIEVKEGNSEGEIIIPSSLDGAETALIAATLETIERVGPCIAEIKLLAVEDTRSEKRKFVVDKAKEILKTLSEAGVPNVDEVSEQIKAAVRSDEITNFKGLPCGPSLLESESIIIVEGRADVVNLLRFGIKNTIAIEGTSVPAEVAELTKQKSATVFVDGDRGGDLIIKELTIKADIDFITKAPVGKEVEELTQKEVFKALREKIPIETYNAEGFGGRQINVTMAKEKPAEVAPGAPQTEAPEHAKPSREYQPRYSEERRPRRYEHRRDERRDRERPARHESGGFLSKMGFTKPHDEKPLRLTSKQKEQFSAILEDIVGTRAACITDEEGNVLGRVPISEVENTVSSIDNAYAVIMDGKVNPALAFAVRNKGAKFVIAAEKDRGITSPMVLEKRELER